MKKLLPVVFASVVVPTVLLLAGCGSDPDKAEKENVLSLSFSTTVTETLNGAEIPLEVGQQLHVRLQSNRASGHQWVQVEPMRGMLHDASPRHETTATQESTKKSKDNEPSKSQETSTNTSGTDVFTFTAARPGTQALTFEYRRSWETSQEASKKIRYRVVVR